jgi:TetR/AcrR family transcriptional repressor of lmrAB and yxaGH operons
VQAYFAEWVDALAAALTRGGRDAGSARALSEDVVGGIQGALVLARAAGEPELFMRSLERMRQRLR